VNGKINRGNRYIITNNLRGIRFTFVLLNYKRIRILFLKQKTEVVNVDGLVKNH